MTWKPEFGSRRTPQSEKADEAQVPNLAGGYAWACDDWQRLDRFLVLGSEGGTYYATERELTRGAGECVLRCAALDARRTVSRIAEIAQERRAPRRQPGLWALALVVSKGSVEARRAAREVAPGVLGTGWDLLTFIRYATEMRGWGRLLKGIVGDWWASRVPTGLAYQVAKYAQRDGWSMRDVLRSAGSAVGSRLNPGQAAVARWVSGAGLGERRVPRRQAGGEDYVESVYPAVECPLPGILAAIDEVRADPTNIPKIVEAVTDFGLTREMVPTEALADRRVWEALVPGMPYGALLRNLGALTARGVLGTVIADGSPTMRVANRIAEGRAHPLALLNAARVYEAGHGDKGRLTWHPVPQIEEALEAGFYRSIGSLPRHDRRVIVGVDVSGSMGVPVAGIEGMSCTEASAVLTMATIAQTGNYVVMGWDTRPYDLRVRPGMSLPEVVRELGRVGHGGTDASIPMRWAIEEHAKTDAFVVLTDTETWAGDRHAFQELQHYRATINVEARMVWAAMAAVGTTLRAPDDPLSVDIVGLDVGAVGIIDAMCRGGLGEGVGAGTE